VGKKVATDLAEKVKPYVFKGKMANKQPADCVQNFRKGQGLESRVGYRISIGRPSGSL
jgi:hypothetical protein